MMMTIHMSSYANNIRLLKVISIDVSSTKAILYVC